VQNNGYTPAGGVAYTTEMDGSYSVWYDPNSSDSGDGTGPVYDPVDTARNVVNQTGYALLGIGIAMIVLVSGYYCAFKPWYINKQIRDAERRRIDAIRAADGPMDGIRVHGTPLEPLAGSVTGIEGTETIARVDIPKEGAPHDDDSDDSGSDDAVSDNGARRNNNNNNRMARSGSF
jgi:hypothetical protein